MTEKERKILEPFIALSRTIPETWPGECPLDFRLDRDVMRGFSPYIYLSYWDCHAQGAPTIDQWRALAEMGETQP